MSTQVITYPALDSGPFSTQRNTIRLEIPNDGNVYDLSQSSVRIHVEIAEQTIPWGPTGNTAIIDRYIAYKGPNPAADGDTAIFNHSLVRNVELKTQRQGVADVRRYNNYLMANLGEYMNDRAMKNNKTYKSLYAVNDFAGFKGGMFTQLVSKGAEISIPRMAPVDIPLSDLSDLGNVPRWPIAQTGATTFTLEIEDPAYFEARQVQRFVLLNDATTPPSFSIDITGTYAANATNILTRQKFYDEESIPFYTGQPIIVTATPSSSGSTAIDFQATITEVALQSNFKVQLELSVPFPAPATAGDTFGSVTIAEGIQAASAISLDRAELRLVRVMGSAAPAQVQYLTYGLRDISMSTLQFFTTTVQVPSDRTPNIVVLWNNPTTLASIEDVQKYRIAIDDKYEGQPVPFGSSRHREMITRGFQNANMPLRDLTEIAGYIGLAGDARKDAAYPASNALKVIVAPVIVGPPGEPDRVIQLEFQYASDAQRRIFIYSQEFSMLNFGGVGVGQGAGPGPASG